tara:strand:- start:3003 stop:4043 length:1041 start_codon:yes stop_codon:yes gene_type:complete
MLKINDRIISENKSPYIIAELSGNHNGSIEIAKKTIKAAKEFGADAIKLQTYNENTMTINCNKDDFLIKNGLWKGYTLFELYKEAHTPFEWHKDLFSYAKEIGITIFSSPFDESAVDLLESLNTPAYKIASFEICDIPLIRYIASKRKPMLISTGMASPEEITEAINNAKDYGCNEILIFHCISAYPTPIEKARLKTISFLKDKYQLEVGLSDHTIGNNAAIAAIALGASAIEKHFILDRTQKGPDSEFSIEPNDLNLLKKEVNEIWIALGKEGEKRPDIEKQNKVFRRSLYFVKDLKKGSIIKKDDIKRIRPGFGIPPKYEDFIIGKSVKRNISRGDPVKWELVH